MRYINNRVTKRPKLTAELKINTVKYYRDNGLTATQLRFGIEYGAKISRSTIYSWIKQVNCYDNRGLLLTNLNLKSRKPTKCRESQYDSRLDDEIIRLRHKYPIMGKDKLYCLLIPFSKANGINTIGKTTIGKILRKLKISRAIPTIKPNFEVSLNGKTGKVEVREIKAKMRKKKNRKPIDHKAKYFGDVIQCDAITYQIGKMKKYFVCCIDLYTRISYAKAYDILNSANATDCIGEFERIHKVKIKHVQTDNGLEYHRYFDQYLEENNIKHYWNYPRRPKMNAHIERFNRTIEDEFIDWNLKNLKTLKCSEFNQILSNYLDFYNRIRPHHSLQLMTPMQMLELSNSSPECM